jgi:hypothetical protein
VVGTATGSLAAVRRPKHSLRRVKEGLIKTMADSEDKGIYNNFKKGGWNEILLRTQIKVN